MSKSAVFLILLILTVTETVYGSPSGLNLIPTAYIAEPDILYLEMSVDKYGSDSTSMYGFEMGLAIGLGAEIGYDAPFDGDGAWNLKLALASRRGESVLAVGVQNLAGGLKAQPYLVGCLPLDSACIHAGFINIESDVELMLGYNVPISDKLEFLADYTSGDDNAASIGAAWYIGDGWELDMSYYRYNSDSDQDGYMLYLSRELGL